MTKSRSWQRWTTSGLLLVAGAAHVPLIREHLREAPYVGWGFVLFALSCLVLAVWVATTDEPKSWMLSGAVCVAALAAYLASRTVGLPQIGDDIGNWSEPMSFPALTSEVLVVALAASHLLRRPRPAAHAAR